jgi:hypothetical protein
LRIGTDVTRKGPKPMSLSLAVIALLVDNRIHSALEGMIGAVTVTKSACDRQPANISTSSRLTKMYGTALSPRILFLL